MASKIARARLARVAKRLYPKGPMVSRILHQLRPYICPFEVLVNTVPPGSRILDVGCGAGLFLGMLAYTGRISYGRGFDASKRAIELAHQMQSHLPHNSPLKFEHKDVAEPWPKGVYDVVSIIDVLHHVSSDQQQAVILQAAAHIAPHGMLIYKDMVRRPAWRAWANRLHDLLVARDWIHYAEFSSVAQWALEGGLVLTKHDYISRFYYGHEMAVFVRSPPH